MNDEIISYMKEQGPITLRDLCNRFGENSETIRLRLKKMERNGHVAKLIDRANIWYLPEEETHKSKIEQYTESHIDTEHEEWLAIVAREKEIRQLFRNAS